MFIVWSQPPQLNQGVESQLLLSFLLHAPTITYEGHGKGNLLTQLYAQDGTATYSIPQHLSHIDGLIPTPTGKLHHQSFRAQDLSTRKDPAVPIKNGL